MALLLAMILACASNAPEPEPSPEPAPKAEEEPPTKPTGGHANRKKKVSADDFGSDELVIPLLKFASDALPRTVPGLRPSGGPGEYEVDPETFEWAGPPVREGRMRYAQRRLRKAVLTVAGRANCDKLIEAISAPHGEPQETVCAQRFWQTADFGIRYNERPPQAICTVVVLVDSAFPPAEAPGSVALDTEGVFGVQMGAPIADFADITATEERAQVHRRAIGNPSFEGVTTYAPTWSFFDGKLEEVSVRANEDDCTRMREALVDTYGPGNEASGKRDLNWVGCNTALEFRQNDALMACRATARSVPEYFARVEYEANAAKRKAAEGQAVLQAFVSKDGEKTVVSKGIIAWLKEDPARAEVPYTRKTMARGRDGEVSGLRITDVPADGLIYALGFRDRDWIMEINGQLAHEYKPEAELSELKVTIRRGSEDQHLVLSFEEGVLQQIREIRSEFP